MDCWRGVVDGADKMKMRSATTWMGIMGGMLMVLLMGRGFRGSIMYAILFVTFVSWIPGHDASFFDDSFLGKSRRR
jgi:AGZA family xanthine/uracil permease-like MFS transporter